VHIALKLSSNAAAAAGDQVVLQMGCCCGGMHCGKYNGMGSCWGWPKTIGQCFWPMELAGVFVGARRVFM